VLLFVEFLEYLSTQEHETLDDVDEDLWAAVVAYLAYRSDHPNEQPDVFDSGEAFLAATKDL
jgi:hypothetical protein